MSWYQVVAAKITKEITEGFEKALRREGDGVVWNEDNLAAIIAKHDPARWRDVEAEPPKVDGGKYEIFGRVGLHEVYGYGWWDADRKRFHNNTSYQRTYFHSVTHYREVNFPGES